MNGNSFGNFLSLVSFGESHGAAVGGVLLGFPAGFSVDFDGLQAYVNRRSPVDSAHSTTRKEADKIEFLSGIFEGKTLGTPIAFIVKNTDKQSSDYDALRDVYRPSHADFSWQQKYGVRDHRGGGRSSARETVARVVAGGLALQFLASKNIDIVAAVTALGDVVSQIPNIPPTQIEVDAHPMRCVDGIAAAEMLKLVEKTKFEKDSLGGTVNCWISGVPAGIGEPVFDKLTARLAAAMLSINTAKGFTYGNGYHASKMKGSTHNDVFVFENEKISTKENKAGGVLGGISTGEIIYFSVAFKPIASIGLPQKTVDATGVERDMEIQGRHDITVLPRVIPIVESMAALTILDFYLLQSVNI